MSDLRYPKYQLRVNNPDGISSIDVLDSIQSQYAGTPPKKPKPEETYFGFAQGGDYQPFNHGVFLSGRRYNPGLSHMMAILVNKAAIADPGKDIMQWYMSVVNPKTARGIGLDIWGRIVGASRTLEVAETKWLGFSQAYEEPFDSGVFWNGENAFYTTDLSDDDYRTLIFWKAAANIASAESPALNQLLQNLFPGRTCFVLEIRPMHIRVVTRVGLSAVEEAIFRRYGLIAKGAGVGVEWLDVPEGTFGFAGAEMDPFGQGSFYTGNIINQLQSA